jgi:NADPH:quinone reductase-like Zn-dependent oxidoreductase
VATTCSPSNAAYLRSLGASGVFDYRSATVADDIRAWSRDADAALTLAWDCISTADSARICARAMSRTRDGRYRSLLVVEDEVVKAVNERVESGWTLGYTILGEAVVLGSWAVAAVEADFEFGKMFWELAWGLLARGEVKPARRDVNRGGEGLEGVLVGLGELRESKVSGVKLVYTM